MKTFQKHKHLKKKEKYSYTDISRRLRRFKLKKEIGQPSYFLHFSK